jgi:hypothetical protein
MLYPEIPTWRGYKARRTFNTLMLGPTDGDFIQRRSKRTAPLYEFTFVYSMITAANMKLLWDFYEARLGPWEAFELFDAELFTHSNVLCGTGDGVEDTFDLVGKECSNRSVTVNGVGKTEGVHYNYSAGMGTNGQDQIVFTPGNIPATGHAVVAEWRGRRYYTNCIFADDGLDRESFTALLFTTGVRIIQVSS